MPKEFNDANKKHKLSEKSTQTAPKQILTVYLEEFITVNFRVFYVYLANRFVTYLENVYFDTYLLKFIFFDIELISLLTRILRQLGGFNSKCRPLYALYTQ